MKEERLLSIVNDYTGKTNWDFPMEYLGVGDKLILSKIVREQAKVFEEHNTPVSSTIFVLSIRQEMEKYGFKSREL